MIISRILRNKSWNKASFRFAARWRIPWLAAQLLRRNEQVLFRASGSETRPQVSSGRPKRALILNAGKAGVKEDIEQIFLEDSHLEIITWPSYALPIFAEAILAPGLTHNQYVTNIPAVEKSKQRYRKFLKRAWKRYIKALPVDLVLSVNFGYYAQREFAAALEESETPFVVLHKENFNGITPKRAEFWRAVYKHGRGKFRGRKILVYNQIERDLQISSGIVTPDKIVVTGMPRLDRIHRWRRDHAGSTNDGGSPCVLFFGFSRIEKVPVLIKRSQEKSSHQYSALQTSGELDAVASDWSDTDLAELCKGTCEAIAEFARRRPDVRVAVKTKAQFEQSSDTLLFFSNGMTLPANIEIVTGGDPFELLTQANVVVGFNTTGLIEALAAGKPVIVPRFAEACQQNVIDFALDLGETVEYANSLEHLVELISRHVDQQLTTPSQLSDSCAAMLRRLVGNDDGSAGSRILTIISGEAASGAQRQR